MNYILLFGILVMGGCIHTSRVLEERQLTFDDAGNHDLDNNDNFSPDGQWLVYDTRTDSGGIGGNGSIERVNTVTGEIEVLYHLPGNQDFGPGVGAASYHPFREEVIFIHGLPGCTAENPYQQWRRTGVVVHCGEPGVAHFLDSRDVISPFTPGALRGGTHRHEWSRDGRWVGFTYNDAIMKALEDSSGTGWNLRTIGVSSPRHQVAPVAGAGLENIQGEWFSALVVRVVPNPEPGSDEISHAASDSWVGNSGYMKSDGSRQAARAFIGRVISREGIPVDELFIVDIPDSINVAGESGPLEGTAISFPMPPRGAVQRRLTYTARSSFPGCSGVVRTSPDGERIAYLARDKAGIRQLFLMSPRGGEPVQLTSHQSDVQSGARWNPDGRSVIYVWDNSVVKCEVSEAPFEKRFKRVTARTTEPPENIVWSNDGKQIAFNRYVTVRGGNDRRKQIFLVTVPSEW